MGTLKKIDRQTRQAIRALLTLPQYASIPMFHAAVSDGGLDVSSLRWQDPLMRFKRLCNIKMPGVGGTTAANTYIAAELICQCSRALAEGPIWIGRCSGLRDAHHGPQAYDWAHRREGMDRTCRGGCHSPGSTNHVLQKCPRTHAGRIKRHDAVLKCIQRGLRNKGFQELRESRCSINGPIQKPNLIAIQNNTAHVIDAQVITDATNLDQAHRTKTAKYCTEAMKEFVGVTYKTQKTVIGQYSSCV
ncbi:hypothetical protein HUJ05_000977 [Dendroctonus ponderosae]|nr:hypothetical protein HUJ05_000977 [Dendroctonus ponderosae]